jgi:hypothetical protein
MTTGSGGFEWDGKQSERRRNEERKTMAELDQSMDILDVIRDWATQTFQHLPSPFIHTMNGS